MSLYKLPFPSQKEIKGNFSLWEVHHSQEWRVAPLKRIFSIPRTKYHDHDKLSKKTILFVFKI